MEGNARRALVVLAVTIGTVAIFGRSGAVTAAGTGQSTACIFDHQSLRTAKGTCRPRARAYPHSVKSAVRRAIYDSALTFGIPYTVLLQIAMCESGLNPRAAYGGHYGLYQFLPDTFSEGAQGMRSDTGITAHSYWNSLDSAYVAGYLFVTGDAVRWSCNQMHRG